ncbi:MAG TPA: sortase [Actinomycetota bacterium]|nr:sortase [Actinomycetota bacterium]
MDAPGRRPDRHRRRGPGGRAAPGAQRLSGRNVGTSSRRGRQAAPRSFSDTLVRQGSLEAATALDTREPRISETSLDARRQRSRRKGRILRFFGKTFLTAAVILAAYIAWLLWGTGLYTSQQQRTLREDFAERVEQADPGQPPRAARLLRGGAYGVLQIPRIGVNAVVVQGTDIESLKKGPGHYPKTAHPWQRSGAVAIAGHRTTYGAWFYNLDRLKRNDRIRLVTDRGVFQYRITRLQVVAPTAVQVLRQTDEPTLVLTTCNPRYSAAQRLIAFADRVEPKRGGPPPAAQPADVEVAPPLLDPDEVVPLALWVLAGSGGLLAAFVAGGMVRERRGRRAPAGAG